MKGKELIQFIQNNKLEDFEVKEGESTVHQIMFGDYIKLDDGSYISTS